MINAVTTAATPIASDRSKLFLVIGLMLAMSIAALDSTVVSTAMPTIVGKLGGLSMFSWVFSIYLLTSTVPVPLYGKLADLYGRKPVLLFGCALFLVGSVLCGLSGSMEQLIFFRAIQGLGAGAILPMVMTVVGDNFPVEQRAKVQGFFSGVWGVSSLLGPVVGGAITSGVSWRWIFLINLPIGIIGIVILSYVFHERLEKRSHVIDDWGTLLLTGSLVSFMLALLQGVKEWGWLGGPTLGLFAVAAFLMGLFLLQEKRVSEPIIALSLFSNKVMAVAGSWHAYGRRHDVRLHLLRAAVHPGRPRRQRAAVGSHPPADVLPLDRRQHHLRPHHPAPRLLPFADRRRRPPDQRRHNVALPVARLVTRDRRAGRASSSASAWASRCRPSSSRCRTQSNGTSVGSPRR